MVNKPLIRPYSWGGVALGGVARIPLIVSYRAETKRQYVGAAPHRLFLPVSHRQKFFEFLRQFGDVRKVRL